MDRQQQGTERAYVEAYARKGSRLSDAQARLVFQELSRLPAEERTASNVVRVASNPENPIHNIIFHVEEDRAAELYFEQRARHVMASIYVRVVREEEVTERPAFYAVTVAPQEVQTQKSYVLYTEATDNNVWQEEIMERVRADLRTFVQRHRRYENIFVEADIELANLLRAADDYLRDQ